MLLGVVLGLVAGLAIGVALHLARGARTIGAARLAESRLADAREAMAVQDRELHAARETAIVAERERGVAVRELELVRGHEVEAAARAQDERTRLRGDFAALSAEALAKNSQQFLALADARLGEARTAAQGDLARRQQAIQELLTPLSETLRRYERGIQEMEADRKGAYAGLSERVAALHLGHEQLAKETRNLVTALRSPHTRGRWGEMTLRRAVERASGWGGTAGRPATPTGL